MLLVWYGHGASGGSVELKKRRALEFARLERQRVQMLRREDEELILLRRKVGKVYG